MKKIVILSLLIISLIPLSRYAEGQTVAKMLTVEIGARSVAMGDAFTAVSGEPYAAAYNPAATYGLEKLTATLGYNTHWEGTRLETGYISFQKRSVVVTGGIKFGAVDDLEWRTAPTEDYIKGSAHDVSAKIGAAFELDSTTVIGFNVGLIYERIKDYDGSAANFDLGVISTLMPNLNIGVAVVNFGSTLKVGGSSFDLPTTYRGGLSYRYNDLLTSADVVYVDDDLHFGFGAEYVINDMLFVRGGYRIGYDSYDISAGFGFKKRNFRIDYAFLPYKDNLNDSHIFNFTFQI